MAGHLFGLSLTQRLVAFVPPIAYKCEYLLRVTSDKVQCRIQRQRVFSILLARVDPRESAVQGEIKQNTKTRQAATATAAEAEAATAPEKRQKSSLF